jgi:hypothetical protein
VAFPAAARGDVLDFEDVGAAVGSYSKIPGGYGGLNWNRVRVVNNSGPAYSDPYYGICSFFFEGSIITSADGQPFDFEGMRITSPGGSMTMDIRGHRGGSQVYRSNWLYPNQHGHIRPTLNWTGIDKITFVRHGGSDYFAIDDFTYSWPDDPDYAIRDEFFHGADLGDQGYVIVSSNVDGLAEIIPDPRSAGNGVLRLYDPTDGPVSVRVGKTVALPLPEVLVEFDYRFLSTAKLNVLLGGVLVDTIAAPADGDGSPGSSAMAQYSETFSLSAAGLTPGDLELALELAHETDPELHVDNLQVTGVPEPASLSLLAMAALVAIRRR